MSLENSINDAGRKVKRKIVGPAIKINTASRPAKPMLMFDRARIPRLTPETAETMNAAVKTAMVPTIKPLPTGPTPRSEEHTSELQSRGQLVCRLLLERKK